MASLSLCGFVFVSTAGLLDGCGVLAAGVDSGWLCRMLSLSEVKSAEEDSMPTGGSCGLSRTAEGDSMPAALFLESVPPDVASFSGRFQRSTESRVAKVMRATAASPNGSRDL